MPPCDHCPHATKIRMVELRLRSIALGKRADQCRNSVKAHSMALATSSKRRAHSGVRFFKGM
jgi:hypothetical protein